MSEMSNAKSHYGLENHGLRNLGTVHWNLSTPTLIEHALRRQEGKVSKDGALVVCTGQHTGRSANDKFVVLDETTEGDIWWGKVNAPYE
ncbi:MAG: phosphoenolpyruvate carboxykinase (ATP), partial [Pseudomonadota bacterium]|nr:phosphoenolpyruvate carboxykinase (ATP) [Pseudomonadota bacterium]